MLLLSAWAVPAVAAVTLDVTVPAASGLDADPWHALPKLDDPAGPALPYHDVTILLGPGEEAAGLSIEALSADRSLLTRTLPVARPPLSQDGLAAAHRPVPGGERLWPDAWAELLGTSRWHGYALAHVRLYPSRLHRADADAGWTHVEDCGSFRLTVETRPAAAAAVAPLRRRAGETTHHRAELARVVLNPGDAALYADRTIAVEEPADGFQPTDAPSLLGSAVDMLIVTNEELAPTFQQLADWRTRLGTPTAVRTLEWIEANTLPAEDTQATLRAFLTDAYQRWGVRWVLLGGDVEIIPTQMIFSSYYPLGEGTDLPVDLYYAGLDGNWNADGDEFLAEPYLNAVEQGDGADLAAELLLGRAPVSTVAAAQLFIDKIMSYEYEDTGAYQGNALFMSEVLLPSDYETGGSITDDGARYSEAIIDTVLFDEAMTADRYYEAWDLWSGAQPESRTAVIDAMNSGQYGLVNHIGHGFFYTMSVGDGALSTKDADALNNDHYFVLNNLNCASAAFDYNSIMERFLSNPDGGAVLAIGSSRAAFPVTAGNYQLSFYRALFDDGHRTAGEAVAAGRAVFDANTLENTVERWTHMTLSLIGDPAMPIWTAAPDSLTVTHPADFALGEQTVEILVERGGMPLQGAVVTLSKDGEDYVSGETGVDGRVFLDVNPKSEGFVYLGVRDLDSRPYLATLPVFPAAPPHLHLVAMSVVDDGTLGTLGNGDGMPDAGETVALVTQWQNSGGSGAAATATVDVATLEPGATILTPSVALPQLARYQTAETLTPILVSLDPALADRTEIRFDFSGLVDGVSCVDAADLEVYAPTIEASILGWNDFPLGDGDGNPEPGEQIRVWLSLLNTGWGAADGLTGWLETGDANVTVHQGAASWPDLPRFAEVDQDQELVVEMTAISELVEAVLHITDSYGREWIHSFSLTRPTQASITQAVSPQGGEALLTWDPNPEADLLGYHVWRSLAPGGPFERMTVQPLTSSSFYRDTGLEPMTPYYYKVAAIDDSRMLGRDSSTLTVSTVPAEAPGFPAVMGAETSSHVAVGDINGDGTLEIVSAADAIYVWTADGNELRDGDNDPTTLGPFIAIGEEWTPAGVVLGNMTSYPGLEIIASCRSGKSIYVFQSDGSVAPGWPQVMNNWNWATPTVADLDDDGDLEVIVNNIQGRTYVWHHDGTEFLDGDADPGTHGVFHVRANEWYTYTSPAVADVDDDGTLEILLGTKEGGGVINYMHALRNDGTDAAGWPYETGAWAQIFCSPAVSDMDDDGVLDIVFISENNRLHVVDQYGAARSGFPMVFTSNNQGSGGICPSPALGDVDEDGNLDIIAVSVISTLESEIHVIGLDGQNVTGWPRSVEGATESSPIVGDVNGDGRLDIVFGIGGATDTQPNLLYAYRHNGSSVPGFPLSLEGPVRATPTITDVDQDGDVDLVYAGWDLAAHVWDFPAAWDPLAAPWPTFQGNPLRTGMLPQNWVTSIDDGPVQPLALALMPNYPNPFNPATSIAFTLPAGAGGRTTLTVHDLRGRQVRTLVDGELEAGRYEVTWTGRDDRGRSQASGVYLYRLRSGGESLTGRMVLVR